MSAEYITEYYHNGNKHVQGYYDGYAPAGGCTEWHENGNKRWEVFDVNCDSSLFQLTRWYENGQMKYEGDAYQLIFNTGLWTYWYENGNKKSEGYYLDKYKSMLDYDDSDDGFVGDIFNPRIGQWNYWHNNSQLACTGVHNEDGLWVFWDEEGNKVHEKEYGYSNREIFTVWSNLKESGCTDRLIRNFKESIF